MVEVNGGSAFQSRFIREAKVHTLFNLGLTYQSAQR